MSQLFDPPHIRRILARAHLQEMDQALARVRKYEDLGLPEHAAIHRETAETQRLLAVYRDIPPVAERKQVVSKTIRAAEGKNRSRHCAKRQRSKRERWIVRQALRNFAVPSFPPLHLVLTG